MMLLRTPNCSTLVVHVIDGPRIDGALEYMAHVAKQGCTPDSGPLSRIVSYRDQFGPVQPVAWFDDDERLHVDKVNGRFGLKLVDLIAGS